MTQHTTMNELSTCPLLRHVLLLMKSMTSTYTCCLPVQESHSV